MYQLLTVQSGLRVLAEQSLKVSGDLRVQSGSDATTDLPMFWQGPQEERNDGMALNKSPPANPEP